MRTLRSARAKFVAHPPSLCTLNLVLLFLCLLCSCLFRIEAGLSAGDTLTFAVSNNFVVDYYDGTKSIVVSNTNDLGGRNLYWGQSLSTIGGIVLILALLIAVGARSLRVAPDSPLLL